MKLLKSGKLMWSHWVDKVTAPFLPSPLLQLDLFLLFTTIGIYTFYNSPIH